MSWWRRWPTHGERGLKPLEGRAAAAHVGCCVLWLCFVLCSRIFSSAVRSGKVEGKKYTKAVFLPL
jgi:hypothetical protein